MLEISDASTPGSDGWWISKLSARLRDRNAGTNWGSERRFGMSVDNSRPGLNLLWDYLRGEPPLPHYCEDWGAQTYPFLRMSRMNYAEICIGAVTDRIVPLGWHTAADNDPDGDQVAAEIAQANDLYSQIPDLAEKMLTFGEAYLMVGGLGEEGMPVITVEDPRETIVAKDQVTRQPLMAFKEIRDEWTGQPRRFLYGPGWLRETVWNERRQAYEHIGERVALPRHDGKIPIIATTNKGAVGDFERHLDALDRINDGIFTRVSIGKYQAYRQRAFEGLPDVDENGDEIIYEADAFTASPGTAWRLPEGTKVWESTYVDLGPVRLAIKDDVESFFAVTRTPLHYVAPEAAQGSAEGASAQREAHVYRAEDRRRRTAAALSRALGLAFSVLGDGQRSNPLQISTIWAPMERYSLASRGAAAQQLEGVLPRDAIFTDVLQYPPAALPRLHAMRDQDLLYDPQADALLGAMAPKSATLSQPPQQQPPAPPSDRVLEQQDRQAV